MERGFEPVRQNNSPTDARTQDPLSHQDLVRCNMRFPERAGPCSLRKARTAVCGFELGSFIGWGLHGCPVGFTLHGEHTDIGPGDSGSTACRASNYPLQWPISSYGVLTCEAIPRTPVSLEGAGRRPVLTAILQTPTMRSYKCH